MIAKYWDDIKIFNKGDDYFNSLIKDLCEAKKQILVESYIFEYDPLTINILTELRNAAKRGCQVRILVDGIGSMNSISKLHQYCLESNIRFRVYHPLPKWSEFLKTLSFFFLKKINTLGPFNRRNHRKCIIIDNNIAYMGSLNLTAIHSENYHPKDFWKDTGIRLTGGSTSELENEFKRNWILGPRGLFLRPIVKLLKRKKIKTGYNPKRSWIRLNTLTRHRWQLYRDLLRRIKQSQSEIFIESAYFLPKRSLLRNLIKAAKRGVRIQIIIPGKSDVPAVKWASYEILKKLLLNNISIYEYQPNVLHSKFLIIDQWASIGSLNLNYRSLFHDLEVEAILNDESSLSTLRNIWQSDKQNAKEINLSYFEKIPFLIKIASRIAFKLRYFL